MASNLSGTCDSKSHQLAKMQALKERQKLILMNRFATRDSSKLNQPAVVARAPKPATSFQQTSDSATGWQQTSDSLAALRHATLFNRASKSNTLNHSAVMGLVVPGTITQSPQVTQTLDSPGISTPTLYLGNAQVCEKVSIGQNDALTIDNTVSPPTVSINGVPVGGGPPPSTTLMVYVRIGGNDVDGDGSILNPYATVLAAMASITNASASTPAMIDVGPGVYTDNFSWKAFVSIRGSTPESTIIQAPIDLNDSSWGVASATAVAEDIGFNHSLTMDFTLFSSRKAEVIFTNCLALSAVITIFDTASSANTNTLSVYGGSLGNVVVNGGLLATLGTSAAGVITVHPSTDSASTSLFTALNTSISGAITVNTSSSLSVAQAILENSLAFVINVFGPGSTVIADVGSTNLLTTTTITGGGEVVLATELSSLSYAADVNQWVNPAPTSAIEAFNRLVTEVVALKGGAIP